MDPENLLGNLWEATLGLGGYSRRLLGDRLERSTAMQSGLGRLLWAWEATLGGYSATGSSDPQATAMQSGLRRLLWAWEATLGAYSATGSGEAQLCNLGLGGYAGLGRVLWEATQRPARAIHGDSSFAVKQEPLNGSHSSGISTPSLLH